MSTPSVPFSKTGSMGETEPEQELCSALRVHKCIDITSSQKTEHKTLDLLTGA